MRPMGAERVTQLSSSSCVHLLLDFVVNLFSWSRLPAGYGSTRVSNRACPYVIHSEKEALARASNTSIPGNIVKIEHLRFCRTGNHFSTVFRNLALGYCCKSKLVSAKGAEGLFFLLFFLLFFSLSLSLSLSFFLSLSRYHMVPTTVVPNDASYAAITMEPVDVLPWARSVHHRCGCLRRTTSSPRGYSTKEIRVRGGSTSRARPTWKDSSPSPAGHTSPGPAKERSTWINVRALPKLQRGFDLSTLSALCCW